jgi:hypothetical protein
MLASEVEEQPYTPITRKPSNLLAVSRSFEWINRAGEDGWETEDGAQSALEPDRRLSAEASVRLDGSEDAMSSMDFGASLQHSHAPAIADEGSDDLVSATEAMAGIRLLPSGSLESLDDAHADPQVEGAATVDGAAKTGDSKREVRVGFEAEVHSDPGSPAIGISFNPLLSRGSSLASFSWLGGSDKVRASNAADAPYVTDGTAYLQPLSHMCPVHPTHRLVASSQSKVFPYRNRRTCCIEADRQPCGVTLGGLFHCTHRDPVTGGEDCGFAVCEEHFRGVPITQRSISEAAGFVYRFSRRPLGWWVGALVITVAIAVYYPVVTTALMVLACHPTYQCVFDGCWTNPSADFISAAYLAALTLLLFGAGLPVAMFLLLRRRGRVLEQVFLGPCYNGAYAQEGDATVADRMPDEVGASMLGRCLRHVVGWLEKTKCASRMTRTPVSLDGVGATDDAREHGDSVRPEASAARDTIVAFLKRYLSTYRGKVTAGECSAQVSGDEYARFQESDESVLAQLYADSRFESMAFTTVSQFGRVVFLIPPIVATPGSLEQIESIVAGEVVFFAIVMWKDPFVSVWLKGLNLVGTINQLVVVGLQAYTVGVSYERDVSNMTGVGMAVTTALYLVIVVVVIGIMFIGEWVSEWRNKRLLARVLARCGFTSLRESALFALPIRPGPMAADIVTENDLSDLGGSDVDSDFEATFGGTQRHDRQAANDSGNSSSGSVGVRAAVRRQHDELGSESDVNTPRPTPPASADGVDRRDGEDPQPSLQRFPHEDISICPLPAALRKKSWARHREATERFVALRRRAEARRAKNEI